MIVEIKVPSPGESITEVQIAGWLAEDGEYVEKDQDIVEIDSDKATLSIAATESGTLKQLAEEGDTVEVGSIFASIDTEGKGVAKKKAATKKEASVAPKAEENAREPKPKTPPEKSNIELTISPLARKLMETEGLGEQELVDFFKNNRIGKKDVEYVLTERKNTAGQTAVSATSSNWTGGRESKAVKMSMLRKKLAQRLVSVKNETAMLTTFNEVNMTPIMDIRKKYKEIFKEQHGVGLGFMSFFTKAVTEAIPYFPAINSQLNGEEVVTFDYVDVSIAVSSPKGLVVPVIRNAEILSLAGIEDKVKELAIKARDNKITLEEMQGGTFTITNGGVFGSMMSTPILNPPQSAILGMHNIVQRPIAVNGKVEIHPMMFVALSYDHRIVDGRESVGFLVKVKEMLENPAAMLFGGKNGVEVLLGL
ncbi:MAG: 2-oxoglutarate dehydrogenase complex dihydrolipoyllysine-residue succinyltransferase [Bacteroidales bacterium]|nr:2-oxoglutarate dehydrogenase complex dihydrolipoyllysine-residue succinyltransferase [Bacteroidales bacterium]